MKKLLLLLISLQCLGQNTFNAVAVRTNLTVAGAPPVLTVNTLADVITFQPQTPPPHPQLPSSSAHNQLSKHYHDPTLTQ